MLFVLGCLLLFAHINTDVEWAILRTFVHVAFNSLDARQKLPIFLASVCAPQWHPSHDCRCYASWVNNVFFDSQRGRDNFSTKAFFSTTCLQHIRPSFDWVLRGWLLDISQFFSMQISINCVNCFHVLYYYYYLFEHLNAPRKCCIEILIAQHPSEACDIPLCRAATFVKCTAREIECKYSPGLSTLRRERRTLCCHSASLVLAEADSRA